MNKKASILAAISLLLVGCDTNKTDNTSVDYDPNGYTMKQLEEEKLTVTFYYNFGKQEINLNSGLYATGSTTALKVDQVSPNSKVERPDIDPLRKNYEFAGWHLSATEESLYNFDTPVTANLTLYAHWAKASEEEEEFVEPEYVEPSKIDNSITSLIEVSGVFNMPVTSDAVNLTSAGIMKLADNKDDVSSYLNYKIKEGVTLTATFDTDLYKINYSAFKDAESVEKSIKVNNVTASLNVANSTYENKARNYENKALEVEEHRIMLAGSSSIENWSSSTEDLKPLTTYNHGIGGTTVDEWRDKLNQRLVYPFSPKIVVYYVGVNNIINAGDNGTQTASKVVEMFDDVHSHLPNTHIYYILINSLPGYPNKQNDFNIVNDAAKQYESSHDYLTVLDAGVTLLKKDGVTPNAAYFLTDGLHMSLYGYVLWGNYIKNKLIADLKKND